LSIAIAAVHDAGQVSAIVQGDGFVGVENVGLTAESFGWAMELDRAVAVCDYVFEFIDQTLGGTVMFEVVSV
jgi:hypothetical protein